MVLIVHKRSEDQQFLYQTSCTEPLEKVVRDIVHIHNARLKLKRLITVAAELAQYGYFLFFIRSVLCLNLG
jgi:hypothetical protein